LRKALDCVVVAPAWQQQTEKLGTERQSADDHMLKLRVEKYVRIHVNIPAHISASPNAHQHIPLLFKTSLTEQIRILHFVLEVQQRGWQSMYGKTRHEPSPPTSDTVRGKRQGKEVRNFWPLHCRQGRRNKMTLKSDLL
jgi:hypothetical protein